MNKIAAVLIYAVSAAGGVTLYWLARSTGLANLSLWAAFGFLIVGGVTAASVAKSEPRAPTAGAVTTRPAGTGARKGASITNTKTPQPPPHQPHHPDDPATTHSSPMVRNPR